MNEYMMAGVKAACIVLHAIVLILQTTASDRETPNPEINFDLEIDRAYDNSGDEESLAVLTPAKQKKSWGERTFSTLSEAAFRGASTLCGKQNPILRASREFN